MRPRPTAGSLVLGGSAAITAAALLVAPVYLTLRAATGGAAAWEILDAQTARIVFDTVVLVAVVCTAALLVAVPLAWLVTSTDLPLRGAVGVAAALPLVLPSYVASLALLGALGPRGLVQQALEPFGVERLPDLYGLPGAAIALTLSTYPYVFLLACAGFRSLDPALAEAARSLGRSRTAIAREVILPALRPSLAAGTLLVALYTLADFGAVALMQYPSLTRAVYLQYTAAFDRTSAAVLGLLLAVLAAAIVTLNARVRRGAGYARIGRGSQRRPRLVRLARWRTPAAAYAWTVVTLFLVLPLGVLCWWTIRGVRAGNAVSLAWDAAFGSVSAALGAALAATALALPVALLARRHPSRVSRALARSCFVGNALPGIVVALALVFLGARYGGALYQSLGMLLFAYIVRFLPESLAGIESGLATVGPRFEEAARSLGRRPVEAFVRTTGRLALPATLAGAALVFLSVMKELPATLLLKPIGFETLATRVWTATTTDAYSDAAPAALLLVVLSAPLVWALTRREALETAHG
ncbi:MAG: iron ABC transporter permease [Thermoleophilia bacterium]|nr:iron ABC transporter permease [Thermoleophilia bacterium]